MNLSWIGKFFHFVSTQKRTTTSATKYSTNYLRIAALRLDGYGFSFVEVYYCTCTYSTIHTWWTAFLENLPLRQVLPPLPPSNYIGLYHTYQIFHFRAQSFIPYVAFTCHSGVPFILSFMCRNPHIIVQASHLVIIQVSQPTHSLWLRRDNPIIHCTSQSSIVHTLQSSVAHPSHSFSLHASHSRIVHTSHPSVVHASQSFSRSCISLAAWSLLDLVFSLT